MATRYFKLWDWFSAHHEGRAGTLNESIKEFLDSCDPTDLKVFCAPEEFEFGILVEYAEIEKHRKVAYVTGIYDWKEHKERMAKARYNNALGVQYHPWPHNATIINWGDYFLYYSLEMYSDNPLDTSNRSYRRATYLSHITGEKPYYSKNPTKLFNNLNHRTRAHRVMMLDYLTKENLINDNVISYVQASLVDTRNMYIPKFGFDPYGQRILDSQFCKIDQMIPPVQCCDTAIDLISESNPNALFLTEKTYKPILWKRPFIVFGPYGMHRYLESLGYKLPRHVIDYSFDDIEDNEERCRAIVKEVKRLSTLPYDRIVADCEETCEHNLRRALHIAKQRRGIPNFIVRDNANYQYMVFKSTEMTHQLEHLLGINRLTE